jgi:crotonobetainyl-CoA:carnitine CoA-transferase CaiB-like acyl-CoA transferase
MTAYCLALGLLGVHLDLSQREVVSWTLAAEIRSARQTGELSAPTGNARPGRTPHEVYRCHGDDSWVAISCRTDEHRDGLAQLVSPSLTGHSEPWWVSNAQQIDATITQWSSGRSVDQCVKELTTAGVPSVRVATAATRAADSHFDARRVFLESDAGFCTPSAAPGSADRRAHAATAELDLRDLRRVVTSGVIRDGR